MSVRRAGGVGRTGIDADPRLGERVMIAAARRVARGPDAPAKLREMDAQLGEMLRWNDPGTRWHAALVRARDAVSVLAGLHAPGAGGEGARRR